MSPIWDHLRFPVKARSLGQEPSASFSRHPPNLTVDYEDAFDQSTWIPCRRRRGMMGTLTAEQVETFHREGWLLVEQALTAADLDPVQAELEEIVDRNARRLLKRARAIATTRNCPLPSASSRSLKPTPALSPTSISPATSARASSTFSTTTTCRIWSSRWSAPRSTPTPASTSAPSCRRSRGMLGS